MSNAVVTRQGKPSAPGEKVDTSAAPVVSGEKAAVAKAKDEGKAAERKQDIAAKAKAMAPKKGSKPAAAKATRGTGTGGGPATRLTHEWLSAKKKDVQIKDQVELPDGTVINVIGRWTRHAKGALIPMVTGRVVTVGENSTKKKGDRQNAAAAEVKHITKK